MNTMMFADDLLLLSTSGEPIYKSSLSGFEIKSTADHLNKNACLARLWSIYLLRAHEKLNLVRK